MKKGHAFILVFACLVLASIPVAKARGIIFSDPPSLNLSVSILFPAASLDFSDLDFRDSRNRSIKTPTARRQLEKLFSEGLYQLLLQNLTPVKRTVLFLMYRWWNMDSGWFNVMASKTWQEFVATWENHRTRTKLSVRQGRMKRIGSSTLLILDLFPARASFLFLVSLIISSRHILR